jgi:hypothetical protein
VKLFIQVTDDAGETRLMDAKLDLRDDLFFVPGAATVSLKGVKTALDYALADLPKQEPSA